MRQGERTKIEIGGRDMMLWEGKGGGKRSKVWEKSIRERVIDLERDRLRISMIVCLIGMTVAVLIVLVVWR